MDLDMVDASVLLKIPDTAVLSSICKPRRLRVGMDIVQISRIRESLDHFGHRFTERLFTADEMAYAQVSPALCPERLAARFAAKEAALKAFGLANAGVNWRDIEVRRRPDGACHLALHGQAALLTRQHDLTDMALSLSHDGDYATAVVVALAAAD